MNEKEAWLHVAQKFRNVEREHPKDIWGVKHSDGSFDYGICDVINTLAHSNQIEISTEIAMEAKLNKIKEVDNYFYPRTPEGAQERVSLCLRFAEECL